MIMKLNILTLDNQVKGEIDLNLDIFSQTPRADLLHKVVTWQLAKRRSGDHKTKEIKDVEGSTRKIYNQKGGGRARHGSIRGPQFRGGAIIFGPVVRSHETSLNKKIRKLALKVALSLKFQQSSLIILENIKLDDPKASVLLSKLSNIATGSLLIIDREVDLNVKLSAANLKYVDVLPVIGMNVLDVIKHNKLILTLDALKEIEKRLV